MLRRLFVLGLSVALLLAVPVAAHGVALDIGGDGIDDVAAIYDYGSATTGFWVFDTVATSWSTKHLLWKSANNAWSAPRTTALVGNVTGDGRADVVAMYDHGGGTTSMFVIPGSDVSSSPQRWWKSRTGGFPAARVKLTKAPSYKGLGEIEPMAVYDYGSNTTGIWSFTTANHASFGPNLVWKSKAGAWSWARSKVAGGDFNGDGKGDVAVVYNAGKATTAVWLFTSNGSTLTPKRMWLSATGGFDWNNVRDVVAADLDGDGADDVAMLYDYWEYRRVARGDEIVTIKLLKGSKWFVLKRGSGAPVPWGTLLGRVDVGIKTFVASDVMSEDRDSLCYFTQDWAYPNDPSASEIDGFRSDGSSFPPLGGQIGIWRSGPGKWTLSRGRLLR